MVKTSTLQAKSHRTRRKQSKSFILNQKTQHISFIDEAVKAWVPSLTPLLWALSTTADGDRKPSLWLEWQWSSNTTGSTIL